MRLRVRPSSAALCVAAAALVATVAAGHVGAAEKTSACSTSGLVVWLNTQGDHAAGSSYYELGFTNLSGRTCTLQGFPGVSAVSIAGHQLGRAAGRSHAGTARLLRLPGNATAVATIQIANAHNFPTSACRPVVAAAVRVYPPNQTASKLVPFPFPACSRSGPVYLFVRPVRKA